MSNAYLNAGYDANGRCAIITYRERAISALKGAS